MLVEDDVSLIDGLVYSLEKNGFVTDVAETAAEAYGYLKSGSYDLLLLDITLPDGSGYEVCDFVRSQRNQVRSFS